MTIAKNLKRTTVMACLTAFCALGVAGQAEAHGHHHKENKARQTAHVIHAVADGIRALTGQPNVVVTPPVVTPAPVVVTPPVVTPAPVVVTPPVGGVYYGAPGVVVTPPVGGVYYGPGYRPGPHFGHGHGGHRPRVVTTPPIGQHRGGKGR